MGVIKKPSDPSLLERKVVGREPSVPYLARIQLTFLRDPELVSPEVGKRGRLLIAAIQLFASRGYDACGMRDLAKAVGLGAPGIYNYYKSKTDILVAAVDYVLSEFYVETLVQATESDPRALLFGILRRHALYCIVNRTMAKACDAILDPDFMRREMPDPDRRRVNAAIHEYHIILRELLNEVAGIERGVDPDVRTRAVHSIVDRSGSWSHGDALTPEELADQCCALIARMIGVRPPR